MLSHSTYHAYIEYKTEIQKMLSHSTYHAYRVQDRDTENVVS